MSESASGEADSSTDNEHKDSSVECPTCGDTFSSSVGMKCHHKQIHGESLVQKQSVCSVCGSDFTYYPSKHSGRETCSEKCGYEIVSEKNSGEKHPDWDGGLVDITCEWCGTTKPVKPSEVENSRFCSRPCHYKWMSENWKGENGTQYQGGPVMLECAYCGGPNPVKKSRVSESRFCSTKCKANWESENRSGEDHPCWKGGKLSYYGSNWTRQREKALDRDNHTCQVCRTKEDLHVHHIIPIRRFDPIERANGLINLVTMCKDCHNEWEGLYLRPDPR